jgi:hypothetical protein
MLMLSSEETDRIRQLPFWLQILVSPLMLLVLWLVLHRFRGFFNTVLRSLPLPSLIKFVIFGLLVGVVLGVNWTISFNQSGTDISATGVAGADLHPDLVMNTLLYFGPFGGVMLAWYLIGYLYRFTYHHVFWIEGIRGALTEQGFIMPFTLLAGDLLGAVVLLVHLIPAYGVCFASIFLIMPPEELPQGMRKPRFGGYLVFALFPLMMFYLCAVIWYWLLDVMLGTDFL